jgi:hypothetical protein
VSTDVVKRIRAQLATGAGILKTAKALGIGTGTVHRIKREMVAVAAGFDDSSNLDIAGAHRQVKRVCTGIQGETFPSQTAYKLHNGRGRLKSE